MAANYARLFAERRHQVDARLRQLLQYTAGSQARLREAIEYCLLAPGKRLRPLLTTLAAEASGGTAEQALSAGCAVEMVHTYSLIHDDLPALDDDDLRRGVPTCHVAFGEATAILAGDGLLTMAFEVLSHPETHPDGGVRAELVHALAVAGGAAGMVGGQMIDLRAAGLDLDLAGLERLQALKTGALIAFAAGAGALLAKDDARSW